MLVLNVGVNVAVLIVKVVGIEAASPPRSNLTEPGAFVPIPIFPLVVILALSTWLAFLKIIASVVPAPEVLSSVRVEAAPVPPMTRGEVREVPRTGAAV